MEDPTWENFPGHRMGYLSQSYPLGTDSRPSEGHTILLPPCASLGPPDPLKRIRVTPERPSDTLRTSRVGQF